MPVIEDKEFGQITVRKTGRSSSMRATVAPNGTLRLSVPSYTPLFMVRRMIAGSRTNLRNLLAKRPKVVLQDGMSIGKHHTLILKQSSTFSVRRSGQQLIVTLGPANSLSDNEIVDAVRSQIRTILRKEAKQHLPARITHLATQHGFEFTALRFTHASSRWGSCNSKKAISLNIALMTLPYELIDYVLLHELAHTRHLNHSNDFWQTVESVDSAMRQHRTALKKYDPGV